ncbi:hypothetical protein EHQ42_05335 [Leptospira levettii]|uniref:hypothetical protein n=1 Tax=Leptospira levettii TaxID=2023178 RepID=UPI0010838836|nr:hypothetical protein [Leptospira levettii]TGL21508.1 hypothetical protein EHQ42_05335 [Leptospira levettii]
MEIEELIKKAFLEIENNSVNSAVQICLRIARKIKDHYFTAIFLRELILNEDEFSRILYDDIQHLKPEAQEFLYKKSKENWINTHQLDFSFGKDERGNDLDILRITSSEIDNEIKQCELSIQDLEIPRGMHEFDIASFYDNSIKIKSKLRQKIKGLFQIKQNILSRCFNYLVKLEKQLYLQNKNQFFFVNVQNDVNNFFKIRHEDLYHKLIKSSELIDSSNTEDWALLLTLVRKSLQSAADYFFPAISKNYRCSDGVERDLTHDKYLNRLTEFILGNLSKSTSNDLLISELENLSKYVKKLNDISSKGVHSNVELHEAKQGFLGLYFFLYNLIQKTELNSEK